MNPMKRKRNRIFLSVMAYWIVATVIAMSLENWVRWALAGTALLGMFGYMAWSIRDSKRQQWMPPDPSLHRGPDPFLSAQRRTSNEQSSAPLPGNRPPAE